MKRNQNIIPAVFPSPEMTGVNKWESIQKVCLVKIEARQRCCLERNLERKGVRVLPSEGERSKEAGKSSV